MRVTQLTVEHVVVPSTQPYGATVQALEAQLGIWGNWDAIGLQLAEASASWQEVARITEALAGTSGFTIMAKINLGGLLSLTGKPKKVAQYVLGNPLLAVQMIEHAPEVGLYAPLRLVVYEDSAGACFIAYDLPSSLLGQYQREEVDRIALLLDAKLAKLVARAAGGV